MNQEIKDLFMTYEDVLKILSTFDECNHEGLNCNDIWWRTDGEYAPVTFFINCNDLFVWGFSDCEIITIDDIPDIIKAHDDIEACEGGHHTLLWVARKRKCRPQVAYYDYFNEGEKRLFDECGSPENQYGNPKFSNEYYF